MKKSKKTKQNIQTKQKTTNQEIKESKPIQQKKETVDIQQISEYEDRLNQIQQQGIYDAFQYILKSYYNGGMQEQVNIYDFAINRLKKFEVKFKVQQKKSQRIENFKNKKKIVE